MIRFELNQDEVELIDTMLDDRDVSSLVTAIIVCLQGKCAESSDFEEKRYCKVWAHMLENVQLRYEAYSNLNK